MEGKKVVRPHAILLFGAPCSGKSTFGEKFAKRYNMPFYDLDTIASEHGLSRKNTLLLISLLAKTKLNLVIEGGLDTERQRTEMRNALRSAGYDPFLVWIQTDVSTIKSRLKSRAKSAAAAKAEYEERIDRLEAPAETENAIVISGKHTFDTQPRHVLARLAQ